MVLIWDTQLHSNPVSTEESQISTAGSQRIRTEGRRDTCYEPDIGQVLMNPTVREDFEGGACPARGQAAEVKLVTRDCYSTGLSKC